MKLNYKKSQSSNKPDLIDTTSSKKYVYLRQNVVEVNSTDEQSGEDRSYFEYDEAKLTKSEYEEYMKELSILDIRQQRADIDYIALMTGVDLEV